MAWLKVDYGLANQITLYKANNLRLRDQQKGRLVSKPQ
jgi:hypothetical protein